MLFKKPLGLEFLQDHEPLGLESYQDLDLNFFKVPEPSLLVGYL